MPTETSALVEDWLVVAGSNTCTKTGVTLAVTIGQPLSLVPALNTAIFPGGMTGGVICAYVASASNKVRPDAMMFFLILILFADFLGTELVYFLLKTWGSLSKVV